MKILRGFFRGIVLSPIYRPALIRLSQTNMSLKDLTNNNPSVFHVPIESSTSSSQLIQQMEIYPRLRQRPLPVTSPSKRKIGMMMTAIIVTNNLRSLSSISDDLDSCHICEHSNSSDTSSTSKIS